ncbi:type IV toxin-antitoxin system AbiEi family antitoxin domain-containing protein [Virgisporangium ochraceum]|uniref:type IV toxin-antitoxin system AbiEi family antitoxin domain-containing protein n=1 Tax=Virgisporangium ochraceum TaxID=65505 RepID=UPI001940D123|nr:type IV toxin-antitoxin system AbiEi family antitoxin domain-containing protein [Virgisporangium ochraceum]
MFFEVARTQAGVVSRAQARRCGITDSRIAAQIRSGRWQRVFPGVIATFTGAMSWPARLWAALLYAGTGAVLSHRTAAELHGLVNQRPGPVHVSVPHTRRIVGREGLVVHRVVDPHRLRHSARMPPRTCVEETVLDLAVSGRSLDEAVAWPLTAVGSRLTTAGRIADAMQTRGRMRWRRDLTAALADAAAGCHSVLEYRYRRFVERAHGLPDGVRQQRRDGWYDDVSYTEFGVHVELDGRLGHADGGRFRDHRRDNAAVVSGGRVLRYGYADVVSRPCAVAEEVAGVLAASGWAGAPALCPECSNGEIRARHHVDEPPR